ncbi:metal-dependent phosphohydrolase [Streptomyces abyssalis]|uniref:Metal-dependent phosphohydrolase n=1 Tax=Streptomyces abyssalis TaxID=933944 RepID=A0A1E7JGE8_9ACTN|nr:HD domain-containing protein [Streptomyces abyssalis]OEU85541.1 metal-dependent phosphohydrolase [Streptomyces abyssalis]OEU92995.1 metal-dependent phosphohydrolase [Streptomyces abyssalis]OEV30791.1 metal-dependent phosphohydrolase [Streptomyces nanshensis]
MKYLVALSRASAVVLSCAALGVTLWRGLEQPLVALAFAAVIAVGESARVRMPGRDHDGRAPTSAPLGAAGALGYALLGEVGGRDTSHGALQVVAVVIVAALAGSAPRAARGPSLDLDQAMRGVLAVGFAATCFQPLYTSGVLAHWVGRGPYYALCLLAVTLLTGLCDAWLAVVFAAAGTGRPVVPLLRGQLRARVGIAPAIGATGAVIALAVAVAGLWALPVFCIPLLLTQFSFRRYASVRATYRQTIASLARSTEVAGYTPHGHARRVAELSCAVGRELGLADPELTVLEYAALMHDIGQLSLVDPVASGATEALDPELQRRIALLGGAVVRQTGVSSEVAVVVERQADPFREQPLTARIVRAVNAYEDMVAGNASMEGSLRALERLRLGCARNYEPRVVEALSRVVSRGTPG